MQFILRHKETNIEIFRMGGYYYERNTQGDYIRMNEVPQWIIEYDIEKTARESSKYRQQLMDIFLDYFKGNKKVIVNTRAAAICKDYQFFKATDIEHPEVKMENVDIQQTENGFIQVIDFVNEEEANKPIHIGILNGCEVYMNLLMRYDDNRMLDYETNETIVNLNEELLNKLF
jgi:AraC-like DNA-binding protein